MVDKNKTKTEGELYYERNYYLQHKQHFWR